MERHLNDALKKPAPDERLMFIDLNARLPPGCGPKNPPQFMETAINRLEQYEKKKLRLGARGYVFITCLDFHRELSATPGVLVAPFGMGIPDFNRPGPYRLSELHRHDQTHADALNIAEALTKLLVFPATFDGSLPSVTFEKVQPIVIGEDFTFPSAEGGAPLTGKVTSAVVVEAEKSAYVAVTTSDAASHLVKAPLTDRELSDYRAHPESFFGRIVHVGGKAETPYGMFKFLMKAHGFMTRTQLLEKLGGLESLELAQKSDEELRAIYCEGLVARLPRATK
jgi:hypothetical protein